MVRMVVLGVIGAWGEGESGVAAALPPSLCFGVAGFRRSPRRSALLDALWSGAPAGVPRCCRSQTRAPGARGRLFLSAAAVS